MSCIIQIELIHLLHLLQPVQGWRRWLRRHQRASDGDQLGGLLELRGPQETGGTVEGRLGAVLKQFAHHHIKYHRDYHKINHGVLNEVVFEYN